MDKDFFNDYQRHFIELLYGTITRMSTNSANCKVWLLGILTILIALVQVEKLPAYSLSIALILVIVFYLLDSYYLYLEKNFRQMEKIFVDSIIDDKNKEKYLYNFNYKAYKDKKGERLIKHNYIRALISFSTWPFYISMLLLIVCASIIGK